MISEYGTYSKSRTDLEYFKAQVEQFIARERALIEKRNAFTAFWLNEGSRKVIVVASKLFSVLEHPDATLTDRECITEEELAILKTGELGRLYRSNRHLVPPTFTRAAEVRKLMTDADSAEAMAMCNEL
jgi:hypothetical protein